MQLKYESPIKIYGFDSINSPWREQIGSTILREVFRPNPKHDVMHPGLGDYRVVIQASVQSEQELRERYQEISAVTQQIDRAWVYACGHALSESDFAWIAPHIKMIDGRIQGWRTNYAATKKRFRVGRPSVKFRFSRHDWAHYPKFPLAPAIQARDALVNASEIISSLVELHFYAHKALDDYSRLFFLAKALEVVRGLLPGTSDVEKQQSLPFSVSQKLTADLHSLYDIANNRYETRHVIRRSGFPSLHSHMTHEEIATFKKDSDLVIRSVVCDALQIPYIEVDRT